MTSAWDRRIARAEELARRSTTAAELLNLYARMAALQRSVFEGVSRTRETDPARLARYFPKLVALVDRNGAAVAAEFAREHAQSDANREALLLTHWSDPSLPYDSGRFLARVLLQPFAESLAGRGKATPDSSSAVCPFCGAHPVAAVLRGEGDGAKRSLLCSLCATEWEYRRILCPACGEENKDRLPIYVADEFDYVRVDACDTCRTYIKSIDLTKNGLAVPVVDELASVPLNIWAEEQGYAKIEPNLLGL